jgi:hypothetical protein
MVSSAASVKGFGFLERFVRVVTWERVDSKRFAFDAFGELAAWGKKRSSTLKTMAESRARGILVGVTPLTGLIGALLRDI